VRLQLTIVVALLASLSAFGESPSAVGTTGQFEYKVSQIDVGFRPHYPRILQATVNLAVKNLGSFPVRIAITQPVPSVQLVGAAVDFMEQNGGASGIQYIGDNRTAYCAQNANNFTLVRPGATAAANLLLYAPFADQKLSLVRLARFSASLMVQSLDDKKCWIEPLSVADIPVLIGL
jgi:hypothetical protein